MANTVDTFSTERTVPLRRPLNLRSYRAPDDRVSNKKLLLIAAPVGVAVGLLAWRFKRIRPVVTSLAFSALAWSTNAWRKSAMQGAQDTRIDDASDQSFPASDPPSIGH